MFTIGKKPAGSRFHISDEDVLRFADGELPAKRAADVRQHLAVCPECRTRLMDFEKTLAAFTQLQQARFEHAIPPVCGPLTQLRVRLRALAGIPAIRPHTRSGPRLLHAAALAFLFILSFFVMRIELASRARSRVSDNSKPISILTPGETLPVSVRQVCSAESSRAVPLNMRKRVFEAYGMSGASPQDFEVDYLITPDLGGAASLKNLWPEPYFHTAWNAHVKDQLEDRLKHLVCDGKLNLKTAQRDIAEDWIAAYKRYFNTEEPITTSQVRTAPFPVALLAWQWPIRPMRR